MDIDQLISNAESLNIHEIVGDSLEDTKNQITEYQKGQMLHGLRSDGEKIGKYKNLNYARIKYNQFSPLAGYGFVDLAYKREFFRGIQTRIYSGYVTITSTDSKTEKLIKDYSEKIFGLNPEYAGEYSEIYLGPLVTKRIINQIHK